MRQLTRTSNRLISAVEVKALISFVVLCLKPTVIPITSEHQCFMTSVLAMWSCRVTKASNSGCYREGSVGITLWVYIWVTDYGRFSSFVLISPYSCRDYVTVRPGHLSYQSFPVHQVWQRSSHKALDSETLRLSWNNHWKKRWDYAVWFDFVVLNQCRKSYPMSAAATSAPQLSAHPQRAPVEQLLETYNASESVNLSGTR